MTEPPRFAMFVTVMNEHRVAKFDRQRLKLFRLLAGLTQWQLSVAAGVSDTSLSSWEVGRRRPQIGNVVRLATALRVTAEDLLIDEGGRDE